MIVILDHFDGSCPSQRGQLWAAPLAPGLCSELMIPVRRGRRHQRQPITRKKRGAGALVQGGQGLSPADRLLGPNLLIGLVNE